MSRRSWSFSRWLNRSQSNLPSPSRRVRPRLNLEVLEERNLLSANSLLGSQRLAFINGLDSYLAKVQEEVQTNFGLLTKLPIIGDQLADKIDVTSSIRPALRAELLTNFTASAGNDHLGEIRTALYTVLGPGGLALLDDSNDLGSDITIDDIQVVTKDGDPAGPDDLAKFEKAEFALKLKGVYDSAAASDSFQFTFGTEALKFGDITGTSDILAEVNWNLPLKFGVRNFLGAETSSGFYVDTTKDDELSFAVEVTTPNFAVSARFGNFTLDITQEDIYIDSRPPDERQERLDAKEEEGRDSVNIAQLQVRLDLAGPITHLRSFEPDPNSILGQELAIELWTATWDTNTATLTTNDLASFALLDGKAEFNLRAVTSAFNNSQDLPKFGFTLNGGVGFNSYPLSQHDGLSDIPEETEPYLEFNDVTIYLGTYLTRIVKPFAEPYRAVLGPPVDFLVGRGEAPPTRGLLNHPIPIYFEVTGSTTTFIDLAKDSGVPELVAAALILQAVDGLNVMMTEAVADPSLQTLELNIGGVALDQLLGLTDMEEVDDEAEAEPADEDGVQQAVLDDASSSPTAKKFMTDFYKPAPSEPTGIDFPFLKDPMQVIHLLAGKWDEVEFVKYNSVSSVRTTAGPPQFNLGSLTGRLFDSLGIPDGLRDFFNATVVPTINGLTSGFNMNLATDLTLTSRFVAGYDGAGLAKYLQTGNRDDLQEGIFIAADGATTGLSFTGSMTGSVRVGAGIGMEASAGLTANTQSFLKDAPGSTDNKLRLSEMNGYVFEDPLCAFTASGGVSFSMSAGIFVDVPDALEFLTGGDIRGGFTVAQGSVVDFSTPCDPPGVFSRTSSDGTYQLNIGALAYVTGGSDGADSVSVSHVSGGAGGEAIDVTIGGQTTRINDARRLVIKSGNGNDIITITGLVIPVVVEGGDGNDTLNVSSTGGVILLGGHGDDTLTAGGGDDLLDGGDGNDSINGGGGDDDLFDGLGNDTVFGGFGNDRLFVGAGSNGFDGGSGSNELFVTADADITLSNSQLTFAGATSTLSGFAYAELTGGDGANTFTLSGYTGVAFIEGGTGADQVVATTNANFILDLYAGEQMSVTTTDGGSFVLGGIENTRFTGGSGNNTFSVGDDWNLTTILDGTGGDDSYFIAFQQDGFRSITIGDTGGSGFDSAAVAWLGTGANLHFLTASFVERDLDRVNYSGLEGLTINAGSANDRLFAEGTAISTTYNAEDGDDRVYAGRLDTSTLNSIAGLLTLAASNGADTLELDDTGDAANNIGQMTNTRISGLGMGVGIDYTDFSAIDVNLGSGGDTFSVLSLASGTPTVLRTNAGNDVIAAGSGVLNGLASLLTVRGGDGSDHMGVNETAETIDDTGTLTSTFVSGLGSAGIDYAELESLDVALGSGNDIFSVLTLASGTPTLLRTSAGNDVIAAGDGVVNGLASLLTVRGGDGSDHMGVNETAETINDTGTLTSTLVSGLGSQGIDYAELESLEVSLGSGNDNFIVRSLASGTPTTLRTNVGGDRINVGSFALGNGGTLNAFAALLTVRGGSGSDVLNVDESGEGGDDIGTLTRTLLSGLGSSGIDYLGLEQLNIELGSGSDDFSVFSLALGTPTNLVAGFGNDAIHTGSSGLDSGGLLDDFAALLTVRGGLGSDSLEVDDSGDAADNSAQLTSTFLTGLGSAGIDYAEMERFEATLGSGIDTFVVLSLHGETPAFLHTGAGNDEIDAGSPGLGGGGTINDLASRLTVRGGIGTDVLNVDETAESANDTGILTSTLLTGLGSQGIDYAELEQFNASLGSGSDRFSVLSLASTTPATVDSGLGNDLVNAGSQMLGSGGTVNSLSALLRVRGNSGFDTLDVDDTGDGTNNSGMLTNNFLSGLGMAGIDYSGLELLEAGLGSGHDQFRVQSTLSTVSSLVHVGAGNDLLNVGSGLFGTGGSVNDILGDVTVRGDSGFDQLNVDDTGDNTANTATLTDSRLIGMGITAGLYYGSMENLSIGMGTGSDRLNVLSTWRQTDTLVHSGAGHDTFSIGSSLLGTGGRAAGVAGALTLRGDSGYDTAEIDDTGSSTNQVGQLTSSTLTGLGMGNTLSYGGLETLELGLGTGNDSFSVLSTASITSTLVHAGAGDDSLVVGSAALGTNGRLTGVASELTVRGGAGLNTLNLDNTGQASDTTGQLTSSGLTGLGMTGSVSYGGFAGVNLALGSGNDRLRVASTLASSNTLIEAGSGSDTVTVGSSTRGLSSLSGDVTVRGGEGVDRLDLDNTADTSNSTWELTAGSFSGTGAAGEITYGGFASLEVRLGSGHDTVTVRSLAAGTTATVELGDGNDQATLGSGEIGSGGRVDEIDGNLTIRGGQGVDLLDVDDSGQHGNTVGQLTDNSLTGLGMSQGVSYGGFDGLMLALGTGHDRFTVLGTASGAQTTIFGGAGNDVFGVGSQEPGTGGVLDRLAALLTLRGDDGADILNVDDSGGDDSVAGTLTSSKLRGLGLLEGLDYGGFADLNLSVAVSDELFAILSQAAGTTLRIGYNRGRP